MNRIITHFLLILTLCIGVVAGSQAAVFVNSYRYASTAFTINFADFDGTNDYMSRGADLTSNADSKVLTVSLWFTASDTSGGGFVLFDQTNDRCYMEILGGTGKIDVRCRDSVGNVAWDAYSTIAVDDDAAHHFMFSGNAATGAYHMYIDGVDRLDTGASTTGNFTIDYTQANHWVGIYAGSAEKHNGYIGQFYFNNAEYVDLSNASNRLKFYNSGPVDLGGDCSLPTGNDPIVCLKNVYSSFQTNSGYGGNYSVTGTLGDGGTYP